MTNNVKTPKYQMEKIASELQAEKGMYLEVHSNGSRYWRLKYRYAGKEKCIALGVYPEVSLKEAREKRDEFRIILKEGNDPSELRKKPRSKSKKMLLIQN